MNRREQWSVGEHPALDLRVPVGVVEVHVGDAGILQVELESAAAADFEISKTGDRVAVRHPSRWSMRGRSCRVVAVVPRGTDVNVETASAEVRLSGNLGTVRVRTASGDVDVDRSLRLDVTTASGEVTCNAVEGDATITTISGDCSITTVGGRLDASLTSGDLRVERCAGDLAVGSTSGSARIGHCDGSEISVRSISGDVRIGLPSGIRVEADISTVSGRASLPEPAPATTTDRRPVRLRLKTVSGGIRVERTT